LVARRDLSTYGDDAENMLYAAGALVAKRWVVGECSVMVSRDPLGPDGSYRWHLSIAHPSRYPSWDEIKTAVYGIDTLPDGVVMAQILGTGRNQGEWVDVHRNCFHLYETIDPAWTSS
jgi:hypothetical protein